ncbi:SCP2 sterol-binding domain-containing protein [Albimonas sp. CAU 1670]|uniref:SCP2 sterol-binding domain-containing protein n=1 Tax=Albimonas sp. CAU 1670 TaxID=3032599 RepID=UPI0023DC7B0C|nr:SCP2 sterol-binding domain-containing protein [Albimonas sp. CAU 1670]MDF2231653.1 SCP2 sterol-binding domain-containing protein [Albimonas sp. CAU 1670]
MSETISAAAEELKSRLNGQSIDGSVKFDIEGVGALRVEGDEVTQDDSDADCVISADEDTFRGLVSGDLSPTSAFMSGRLKVDGDMSKAMALSSLLA